MNQFSILFLQHHFYHYSNITRIWSIALYIHQFKTAKKKNTSLADVFSVIQDMSGSIAMRDCRKN